MSKTIIIAIESLTRLSADLQAGAQPATRVDRPEIVAHATLSAWIHHWPTLATDEQLALLAETAVIRELEPGRWMTQRRIALAKLVRELDCDAFTAKDVSTVASRTQP